MKLPLTNITLHRRIALVSRQTFTNQRSHRHRVQHLALGIHAARLRRIARLHALRIDARRARRTVAIIVTLLVQEVASLRRVHIANGTRRTSALRPMLVHATLLIVRACRQLGARIGAPLIDARLRRRTITVRTAAEQHAADQRIAAQAGRTLAHGPMLNAIAFRTIAARGRLTSGHTLSIDARMRAAAFTVRPAADLHALDLRVAVVAVATRAHGFVVAYPAFGVRSAIARIAADIVDARLLGGALGVGQTAVRSHRLQRFAGSVAAAHVTLRAHADHRAHRNGRDDLAARRPMARLQRRARIHAAMIDACQSRGALGVQDAFVTLLRPAFDHRIADEAGRTAAQRGMMMGPAFGARMALAAPVDARIDALGILAGLVAGTVGVRSAADDGARLPRIAAVAATAATLRLIVGHKAFGIRSARIVQQTGTDAVAVDARLAAVAFAVDAAAERTAHRLRIAVVAAAARAHGAMVLHTAFGVEATVARIAALSIDAGLGIRAVAVLLAAGLRCVDDDLPALAVRAGHGEFGTFADHRAHGRTVDDAAVGGTRAR